MIVRIELITSFYGKASLLCNLCLLILQPIIQLNVTFKAQLEPKQTILKSFAFYIDTNSAGNYCSFVFDSPATCPQRIRVAAATPDYLMKNPE